MNTQTEIIYIAGYGRSGSTLLERLLQCQPAFQACGEMSNFFKIYGSAQTLCSCGQSLEHCEYWRNVAKDFLLKGFSYCSRLIKMFAI
ncbi:MAG: sulfotransferase [Bacteroidota bacterium]